MVQSLKVDLAEAKKSNEGIELERKLKDEKIAHQNKHIQDLREEI